MHTHTHYDKYKEIIISFIIVIEKKYKCYKAP